MNWAVFVSGEGTNLQCVLDLEKEPDFCHRVVAVVADRECPAIERAKQANKAYLILSPRAERFVAELLEFLQSKQVEAIFLLGYMRILPSEFLKSWDKKIYNLHPSMLPKHKGLRAIEKAVAAKDSELGVSIHEVIAELDSGQVQKQLSIKADYSKAADRLFEEVRALEKQAVREFLLSLGPSQYP